MKAKAHIMTCHNLLSAAFKPFVHGEQSVINYDFFSLLLK